MTNSRVQKDWQQKGLGTYETEAILGTLAHYGVQVDESRFKALAKEQYPLGIALTWQEQWQGKGQFSRFPYAAATELWRRWEAERATPEALADAVEGLVTALGTKLVGRKVEPEPLFERVQQARATAPLKDGVLEETFAAEVFQLLDARGEKFVQVFDSLAEELARKGHVAEAERFAELEEFLLPDRGGVVQAVVRAAKGERDQAVQDIKSLFEGKERSHGATLTGIDGLIHLKANDDARALAEGLLDKAEAGQDFHLGLELCERLALLYEWAEDVEAMRKLQTRAEVLAAAHEKAHPEHAHHHH